ncbi:hypothetical protein E2C01_012047 [Portunus trituberculatus]|uniref:DUF4758 domain-containing protein n=1 Tax=Portunus trituberculatus TaxID=210409 RepID=A0A5B7DD32_PORTR|nr:hypothetical protein [Portunus trituberculatus]
MLIPNAFLHTYPNSSFPLTLTVVGASWAQVPVYIPGNAEGVEPVAPQVVEATPVLMARAVASSAPTKEAAPIKPSSSGELLTKTVYGFLDFTTTVAGTVMVFTPQSTDEEPKATTSVATMSPRKSPPSEPRARPAPTPTQQKLSVTTTPPAAPEKLSPHSSSDLESSFFEPTTTLALEELFSATPRVPEPQPQTKAQTTTPKPKHTLPSSRPFAFRQRNKGGDSSTGSRRRLDLNFLTRKKTTTGRQRTGGSTLVPITVEGTGTLTAIATRVTPAPPPSRLPLSTPSEVVVSATQGFASLSVIGPFSTAVNNELGQVSQHYDLLSSEEPLQARRTFDLVDLEANTASSFPTGMVTKLGGTIVAGGHTTVHETSVIGTYIDGKYAQVLRSTSRIFHNTPAPPLVVPSSPTVSPEYETVKSVIQGSATQFITPQASASLPLESLFSDQSSGNRDSRTTQDDESRIQARLRSALSKRRGSHDSAQSRPRQHDPFVDEEEDHDLQRSGTNLRPSFKLFTETSVRKTPDVRTSVRRAQEVSVHYAQQQQEPQARTFRPRYKPSATRRFSGGRPTRLRPQASGPKRPTRPASRFRPAAAPRPKPTAPRRNLFPEEEYAPQETPAEPEYQPSPEEAAAAEAAGEETVGIVTTTIANEEYNAVVELATVRSLHTFRVGTNKNTRFVTFTKTFTLDIQPTAAPELDASAAPVDDELYETPLFENILDSGSRDVSTLPPIDLGASDIAAVLETVTETFSTTEVMEKMSVLPVLQSGGTTFHTLTQTYHITRVVTAFKTMPPVQAFSFIPENSLNEFNGQLLAEGSENDEALLPGEVELDPNGQAVDPSLAELAGGEFNPDALEQQLHPELAAALQRQQQQQAPPQQQAKPAGGAPQLLSGQLPAPGDPSVATPGLTPEQVQQLAFLRLLNPYSFGGFPPVNGGAPSTTVTSTPVTITTDITTTSTHVFRVIFNARPIMTTISTVEVVHTTLTTFSTSTVTLTPNLPAFPFAFPSPFQLG